MSLRHTILFFLTAAVVVPASAQTTAAGSDIVSRTLLSSYGTRAVEQRVYDSNGALVADKSRGIAYITYDVNNNPQTIYFTNGNETFIC